MNDIVLTSQKDVLYRHIQKFLLLTVKVKTTLMIL